MKKLILFTIIVLFMLILFSNIQSKGVNTALKVQKISQPEICSKKETDLDNISTANPPTKSLPKDLKQDKASKDKAEISSTSKTKPEIIPWKKVKKMLKPKTRYTIIDIETGLSFDVIHRYGTLHSDVEPAAKDDTRILKKIYGEWSWERRAVAVVLKDKIIAASIIGMPHGSQSIKDNNFPGVICVHFWGSAVHKTGKRDPKHHAMIKKASSSFIKIQLN